MIQRVTWSDLELEIMDRYEAKLNMAKDDFDLVKFFNDAYDEFPKEPSLVKIVLHSHILLKGYNHFKIGYMCRVSNGGSVGYSLYINDGSLNKDSGFLIWRVWGERIFADAGVIAVSKAMKQWAIESNLDYLPGGILANAVSSAEYVGQIDF